MSHKETDNVGGYYFINSYKKIEFRHIAFTNGGDKGNRSMSKFDTKNKNAGNWFISWKEAAKNII